MFIYVTVEKCNMINYVRMETYIGLSCKNISLTELKFYMSIKKGTITQNKQETPLSPRDPRDTLHHLKCWPTVVWITQTDRMSAWGALSATATFYSLLVQWHDPTFSRNLAWSNNNHFYAFFNIFSICLKFSPGGRSPPLWLFQNPRWPPI